MAALRSIIHQVRNGRFREDDWLYIAGSETDLTLQSDADLGDTAYDEDSGEELAPNGFAERGLYTTIDIQTLVECLSWADRLANSADDAAALDVIRYYLSFDAFPGFLNAPDPPPPEECQRLFDLAFCEKLGAENPSVRCRRQGCERGVVSFSALCRRHHFESIRERPYPFND